jgi:hypothetical protein
MTDLRYAGETTDIRAWLTQNRPDLVAAPKGKLKNEAIQIYRDAHDEAVPDVVPGEVAEESVSVETDHPEASPEREGESKRSWFSRTVAPKSVVKRPQRRASIDGIMTVAWTAAANIFANPRTFPVAQCLKLQAPAAGMVLDEALKGGMIDKALQPLARAGKRGEAVWAVVGPPMIVSAITARPELYPVLRPLLREAISSWVVLAGPKIRKAKEREEKLLAELGGDMSTIDDMIDSLFMVPEEYSAAYAPAEAAAS